MIIKSRRNDRVFGALAACFCVGVMVGWWLRAHPPAPVFSAAERAVADVVSTAGAPRPVPTTGTPSTAAASPAPSGGSLAELHRRPLRMPIEGKTVESMKG